MLDDAPIAPADRREVDKQMRMLIEVFFDPVAKVIRVFQADGFGHILFHPILLNE